MKKSLSVFMKFFKKFCESVMHLLLPLCLLSSNIIFSKLRYVYRIWMKSYTRKEFVYYTYLRIICDKNYIIQLLYIFYCWKCFNLNCGVYKNFLVHIKMRNLLVRLCQHQTNASVTRSLSFKIYLYKYVAIDIVLQWFSQTMTNTKK